MTGVAPSNTRIPAPRDRTLLGIMPGNPATTKSVKRYDFECYYYTYQCYAGVTEVGCVKSNGARGSKGTKGASGGHPLRREVARHGPYYGYITKTFECGSDENTCRVEFAEDDVLIGAYGAVDLEDTDSYRKWECRSDNGTVRQCQLPVENEEEE